LRPGLSRQALAGQVPVLLLLEPFLRLKRAHLVEDAGRRIPGNEADPPRIVARGDLETRLQDVDRLGLLQLVHLQLLSRPLLQGREQTSFLFIRQVGSIDHDQVSLGEPYWGELPWGNPCLCERLRRGEQPEKRDQRGRNAVTAARERIHHLRSPPGVS